MFGLDASQLTIILIIILVIFGGSQLPKLARSLGTSAKELRKGLKDDDKKSDDTTTTEKKETKKSK